MANPLPDEAKRAVEEALEALWEADVIAVEIAGWRLYGLGREGLEEKARPILLALVQQVREPLERERDDARGSERRAWDRAQEVTQQKLALEEENRQLSHSLCPKCDPEKKPDLKYCEEHGEKAR